MKHTNKNYRNVSRRLALVGLFAALGLPSVSAATTPGTDEVTPSAAMDDPCGEAVVALEIDVESGLVYRVTAAGNELVVDGLDVYLDSLDRVLIDLELTSGEWEVEISPTGSPTEVYYTSGSALRYTINEDHEEYLLSFTELSSGASTMMNMGPIVPDLPIRRRKECPPPT